MCEKNKWATIFALINRSLEMWFCLFFTSFANIRLVLFATLWLQIVFFFLEKVLLLYRTNQFIRHKIGLLFNGIGHKNSTRLSDFDRSITNCFAFQKCYLLHFWFVQVLIGFHWTQRPTKNMTDLLQSLCNTHASILTHCPVRIRKCKIFWIVVIANFWSWKWPCFYCNHNFCHWILKSISDFMGINVKCLRHLYNQCHIIQ